MYKRITALPALLILFTLVSCGSQQANTPSAIDPVDSPVPVVDQSPSPSPTPKPKPKPTTKASSKPKPSAPKPEAKPEPKAVLPSCVNSDCNCSDFKDGVEAQRVFDAYPGDPFKLDRDKDGIPCESLR